MCVWVGDEIVFRNQTSGSGDNHNMIEGLLLEEYDEYYWQ